MIYACIPWRFPTHYPSSTGATIIRLDNSYYLIWGNSVQVHAILSEVYADESEPFIGDYHVLLVNSNENPASSIYNETKTREFRWRSENDSFVYHNTKTSIKTTPIKNVVTIGDTINFNVEIHVEEDLLFECFPISYYEDLPKFQLKEGSNSLSIEIEFFDGDIPHQVLMLYKLTFEKEVFNSSKRRAYGYQTIFGLNVYENTTGEVHEQRHFVDDVWGPGVWILPFSGIVLDQEQVEVKNGGLFCSFPLNTSLSANKMVFASSAAWDSYILDISPLTIYLSPPITLPSLISLILFFAIYRKWRDIHAHISKYKIFYVSILMTIALLTFLYSQTFSAPLSFAMLILTLCVICIGFISVGTAKNNFRHNEYRLFWKRIILLMSSISLYPIAAYMYYFLSSGDLELLMFFPSVLVVVLFVFLGSCLVGMIVNSLISFVAGLFLLSSHLVMRLWYRIHRSKSPAILFDSKTDAGASVSKSFFYYVFEFFLFSLWFVILFSSSVSVSIENLWETIWDTNLILVLVPLSAIVCLLLSYELLDVGWKAEGEKEKKIISPRLLYKFWSLFAVVVFVTKLFWEGLSPSILTDLGLMSYYLLIISSGFAVGFVGTSRIGMDRASKEIKRIAKRYRKIKIQQ